MVARPAVKRQWQGLQATNQGAPQGEREQGWTPTRFAQTLECDEAREMTGLTVQILAPGEGAMTTRVRRPWGRQGRS